MLWKVVFNNKYQTCIIHVCDAYPFIQKFKLENLLSQSSHRRKMRTWYTFFCFVNYLLSKFLVVEIQWLTKKTGFKRKSMHALRCKNLQPLKFLPMSMYFRKNMATRKVYSFFLSCSSPILRAALKSSFFFVFAMEVSYHYYYLRTSKFVSFLKSEERWYL